MGALSTATWRGYSRWVSLCFNDKDLYDDRVLINKFKRCYGSVGLQAVLLSQNDHDSRWFDWKITSVGRNSAMQRIKLIHILQLQPNWERSCESSDINCFFLPSFLSLLDVSSMLLSYAANCSILHSLSQIKSVLVWLVRVDSTLLLKFRLQNDTLRLPMCWFRVILQCSGVGSANMAIEFGGTT